jgi:hypothetical protein
MSGSPGWANEFRATAQARQSNREEPRKIRNCTETRRVILPGSNTIRRFLPEAVEFLTAPSRISLVNDLKMQNVPRWTVDAGFSAAPLRAISFCESSHKRGDVQASCEVLYAPIPPPCLAEGKGVVTLAIAESRLTKCRKRRQEPGG